MNKKLATVEKIQEIIKHPNSDILTIYRISGWKCISQEKYNVGDLVVFIRPDSIVPKRDPFLFLEKHNWRINIIKLRGEYSNGLILPITILSNIFPHNEGDDVTDELGIEKYEKPVSYVSGDTLGSFPTHIVPITDEERLENVPEIINDFFNKDVYVTVKHDGSSVTIYKIDGQIHVCSRRLELKEDKQSKYWIPVYKYDLKNVLPDDTCIQAELVGEGIQKNPEKIKGVDIRIFNIWDIKNRLLFNYDDIKNSEWLSGIPLVDLYYKGYFKWKTIEDMVEEAKNARYKNGNVAEGLVWRLTNNIYSDILHKDISVKTINYNYKE